MPNDTISNLAYADTQWKAADALCGQVDAAEYKHVVFGLLLLKFISDSFEARREELKSLLDLGFKGDRAKAHDILGRVYST